MFFDIREEVEHILSFDDYFDWYSTAGLPFEPEILGDLLPEGKVHSYEMASDSGGYRISDESDLIVVGVTIIRHGNELSCLLLAGENPPRFPDEIAKFATQGTRPTGKEGIKPCGSLSSDDRYFEGHEGFSKVLIMTRYNIRNKTHDVRYVNLDFGSGFTVFTDDMTVFRDVAPENPNGDVPLIVKTVDGLA